MKSPLVLKFASSAAKTRDLDETKTAEQTYHPYEQVNIPIRAGNHPTKRATVGGDSEVVDDAAPYPRPSGPGMKTDERVAAS